jgi:phenylacetic acid degradation operon negative regulatory protein
VKPKTEELLYILLWGCDMLRYPTWRNLTESFEGWSYRNGLERQLARLEKTRLLERQESSGGGRIHRLTDTGCLHALGGRDPVRSWKRSWDGHWRMVLFDVPQHRAGERTKLRRYLRHRGFGYLQNSVWVTPDPVQGERNLLADGPVNVESLLLLEARPCAGETDVEIVLGAWNFDVINDNYARHDSVLTRRPKGRLDTSAAARSFQRWLGEERLAWLEAISMDPLLPEKLHPPGYRGVRAWRTRHEAMARAGEQIRSATVSG